MPIYDEIGKIFDVVPQMFHDMKRVRIVNSFYDSVKLGYLIFANDPVCPDEYFVFKQTNNKENEHEVQFISSCRYLKHIDYLIKSNMHQSECDDEVVYYE